MSFHARLTEILAKDKPSSKDQKELIRLIRTNGLPYKNILLEAGMNLAVNGDLDGDDSRFQILEAMLEASLKTRDWKVYNHVEQLLVSIFGKDRKLVLHHNNAVKALKLHDYAGKHLERLRKDNLVDFEVIKNKISLDIAKGDIGTALDALNEYLEMNPVDKEAWSELADIYLQDQEYTKALFCYEELLMIQPDNLHYMNRVAELHYTLGKKEHLHFAKKYFSQILLIQDDNVRALWGLKYTCQSLAQTNEVEAEAETTRKLIDLVHTKLKKTYSTHDTTKDYIS